MAVGPVGAFEVAAKAALAELDQLVAAGGVAAAGAGVDLGGGFTSARLAGAAGERRDWVLAALRALWSDGARRLGDRTAVAVALFGPRATKRLGAALARTADDGRWAAVHLAVAASDLLGPEKLERLLALEVPEGTDPVPGGEPSVLAGFLADALGSLPEARRLAMLLSLWERVVVTQTATAEVRRRRQRLLRGQDGDDALEPARVLRQRIDDDWVVGLVAHHYGATPSLAQAARWIPTRSVITEATLRLLEEALAAAALVRLAVAATDAPLEAALAEHLDTLIQGACPGIKGSARSQLRRLRGPQPEPGRPGHTTAQIAAAAVLATQPGVRRPVQISGRFSTPAASATSSGPAWPPPAPTASSPSSGCGPTSGPSGPRAGPGGTPSPPNSTPGVTSPGSAPDGRRGRGCIRPTAPPARPWPNGWRPTRRCRPSPWRRPTTCCGSPTWATPSPPSTATRPPPSRSTGAGWPSTSIPRRPGPSRCGRRSTRSPPRRPAPPSSSASAPRCRSGPGRGTPSPSGSPPRPGSPNCW